MAGRVVICRRYSQPIQLLLCRNWKQAAELLLGDDAAAIAVWKMEPDLSIRAIWDKPRSEFRLGLSSFTVVWDEGVLDKMRWLRGEKLPRETGGALLGCWDLSPIHSIYR
jgi:hypothetical protein